MAISLPPSIPTTSLDDNDRTTEPYVHVPVVARACFDAVDGTFPASLRNSAHVYCGLDINLENPVWIRAIPGKRIFVCNDYITDPRSGVAFYSIKGIDGVNQAGDTPPLVTLHWMFSCDKVVSHFKTKLRRPKASHFNKEADVWKRNIKNGLPCTLCTLTEFVSRFRWTNAKPRIGQPDHVDPFEMHIDLPAHKEYLASNALLDAITNFRKAHPMDFITQGQVLVAIYVWYALAEEPQKEILGSFSHDYPLPEVSLAQFILYFMDFLRRTEAFGLPRYTHPNRFISRAYKHDLERADAILFIVQEDSISEELVRDEMKKLAPKCIGRFFPCDLDDSRISPFKQMHTSSRTKLFPDALTEAFDNPDETSAERYCLLAPLTDLVGSIKAWRWNAFDTSRRNHILLAPKSCLDPWHSTGQVTGINESLECLVNDMLDNKNVIAHVLGRPDMTNMEYDTDSLEDEIVIPNRKPSTSSTKEEKAYPAASPSSSSSQLSIPNSPHAKSSVNERATVIQYITLGKTSNTTGSTDKGPITKRKGKHPIAKGLANKGPITTTVDPTNKKAPTAAKNLHKESPPSLTTSLPTVTPSGVLPAASTTTESTLKRKERSPLQSESYPKRVREVLEDVSSKFDGLSPAEFNLVMSAIFQKQSSKYETFAQPPDPNPLSPITRYGFEDVLEVLRKSIEPHPKPLKGLVNLEYSPARESEIQISVSACLIKLSDRVRKLHSILFTLVGWRATLDMRFLKNHMAYEIQGLSRPPRREEAGKPMTRYPLSVLKSNELEIILSSLYDASEFSRISGGSTLKSLEEESRLDDATPRIECFDTVMKIAAPITQYTILALVSNQLLKRTTGSCTLTQGEKDEIYSLLVRIKALIFVWEELKVRVQDTEVLYWGFAETKGPLREELLAMAKSVHPEAESFLLDGSF